MPPRRSTRAKPSKKGQAAAAPYETPPTGDRAPFLSLSPELVDYILAFLIPKDTFPARRSLARSLLAVDRSITPLVRRRLFAKVGLTVDHPKARDELLLEVMKTEGVAEMVRALRIRAPAVEPSSVELDGGNPAAALVPFTALSQAKIVEMVIKALTRAKGLRNLELETRVGVKVEDEEDRPVDWDDEGYRKALEGLTRIESFVVAVAHRNLKLQLLADASEGLSAFIPAMASWSNLRSVDFWRVRIQFPEGAVIPEPTFSLKDVVCQSSEFGGREELIWLFGAPGSKRGSRLEKCLLKELDFIDTPGSSSPLLAIFPSDPSTPPAFALSLGSLVFNIGHPLTDTSDPSAPSLTSFFSSLEVLRQLEIGGEGITTPVLQSLFTPSTGLIPIATRLEVLNFAYTPSIPFRDLLDTLSSNIAQLPRLLNVDMILQGSHPRTWPWEQISRIPLPFWAWPTGEWRELEKWTSRLGRMKGRWAKPGPGAVTLKRNGLTMDVEYESVASSSDDEATEDGEALFEPSSEQEEAVFRRDDSEESDF